MATNTTTRTGFWARNRAWILLAAIVLFLPPLSALFQTTADSNFCGTWCPRMFFTWRNGMTAGDFFAGFFRSYMGVGLVLAMLVSSFFLGRYWCSHLCPIGGTMELGSRLVPKWLKINFSAIAASPFRYGYLAVYFIASALGIGSLCCNYCNFATVPRMYGAAFLQADAVYFLRVAGLINLGLVVVLGFLAKGGRAYCNLLCPVGALDALANRLGIGFGKKMRVDPSKCDSCGRCAAVCPTWSIQVKEQTTIDHLTCIPCRECEKTCHREAITYGARA